MPSGVYVRTWVPCASRIPSYGDLRQAAGFLEGEASFANPSNGRTVSHSIQVLQKDPWPLYQLQEIFGGSVRQYLRKNYDHKGGVGWMWIWLVTAARARGVMMTLYSLLSPRRKGQIRKVLHYEA